MVWKLSVTEAKKGNDGLVFYFPINNIQVISKWRKEDNERLCQMKRHSELSWIMSWILPLAGFEPVTSCSDVWSANHLATQTLSKKGKITEL